MYQDIQIVHILLNNSLKKIFKYKDPCVAANVQTSSIIVTESCSYICGIVCPCQRYSMCHTRFMVLYDFYIFFFIYIYHFPFLLPGHFCCISAFWLHVSFMLCCSSQILVWAVLRVTQSLTMKVSLCAFSICIPAFLNIFFIFILIASFSSQHCLPLFTDRYFASVCLVFFFTRCSKSSALINSIFGSCFFLYNWMPVTISTWAVGYALIHHA